MALAIVVLIVIPFLLSKHVFPGGSDSLLLEQWRCAMAKNPKKTAAKRAPELAKRGVAGVGAGGRCGRRGAWWSDRRG